MLKTKKNRSGFILSVALILFSALIGMAFLLPNLHIFARAEDATEFNEFPETAVETLTNTQFENADSSTPASPDSWTGGYIANSSGSVVSGVISLVPSEYQASGNKRTYKLNQYPEYENNQTPISPFGGNAYPNTNKKVLMINVADNAEAAYGYTSAEMTFSANSFYRVSAYVKTGNFANGTGASIRLNGLGSDIAFSAINTVKKLPKDSDNIPILNTENMYGWVKYSFLIYTGNDDSTVTLSLAVGNEPQSEGNQTVNTFASGYAFFDNVSATQISSRAFVNSAAGVTLNGDDNIVTTVNGDEHLLIANLNQTPYLKDSAANDIGSFSNATASLPDGWKKATYNDPDDETTYDTGYANSFVYNAGVTYVSNNPYGLTADPWSPLGKSENDPNTVFSTSNSNVLLLSTYDGTKFRNGAIGLTSPDFTLEQFKYYRISVWVKTDSLTSGNASVALRGEANNTDDNNVLKNWVSSLSGNDEDTAHYGWQKHDIYAAGSIYSDLKVRLELWLGTPETLASGIAMFDNITFEELSVEDYKAAVENATNVVAVDKAATDTGITNGNFASISNNEDLPYELSDWSVITPDTVSSSGFSNRPVASAENAVTGLLPINKYQSAAKLLQGAPDPKYFSGAAHLNNVMFIGSKEKTAIGYRSAEITLGVDSEFIIKVNLATANLSGYGANLVLRGANGDVLSTIEQINTNNVFKEFSFYVEGPLEETTATVEIWLGLNDRKDNAQKLSSGYVYVSNVALTTTSTAEDSDEDEEETETAVAFADQLANYKSAIAGNEKIKLDYGVYSLKLPDLAFYDRYSTDTIKPVYGWGVSTLSDGNSVFGMFHTNSINKGVELPSYYDKDTSEGGILYLRNLTETRSTISYAHTTSLVANTYYRVDVKIKTDIPEQYLEDSSIGANISLTSTKTIAFENIKDTSTVIASGSSNKVDKEAYRTYSFYLSAGDTGGTVSLSISLGGTKPSEGIVGRLYIDEVSFNTITNTEYDDFVKDYDDKKTDTPYGKYLVVSETTDDSDDDSSTSTSTDNTIGWYIIPTVIFGVCLIAALVLVLVVKIKDKRKSKRKIKYSQEFDRDNVMDKLSDFDRNNEKVKNNLSSFDENLTETNTKKSDIADDKPADKKPVKVKEAKNTDVVNRAPISENERIDSEFDDEPVEPRKKKPSKMSEQSPAEESVQETEPETPSDAATETSADKPEQDSSLENFDE